MKQAKLTCWLGRGGGLVVSIPAFYSDDPSSNPAGYLINFLYEKTKINKKEDGVGPSFKKKLSCWAWHCGHLCIKRGQNLLFAAEKKVIEALIWTSHLKDRGNFTFLDLSFWIPNAIIGSIAKKYFL